MGKVFAVGKAFVVVIVVVVVVVVAGTCCRLLYVLRHRVSICARISSDPSVSGPCICTHS